MVGTIVMIDFQQIGNEVVIVVVHRSMRSSFYDFRAGVT